MSAIVTPKQLNGRSIRKTLRWMAGFELRWAVEYMAGADPELTALALTRVREEMRRPGPHPDMRKEGLRERKERP